MLLIDRRPLPEQPIMTSTESWLDNTTIAYKRILRYLRPLCHNNALAVGTHITRSQQKSWPLWQAPACKRLLLIVYWAKWSRRGVTISYRWKTEKCYWDCCRQKDNIPIWRLTTSKVASGPGQWKRSAKWTLYVSQIFELMLILTLSSSAEHWS